MRENPWSLLAAGFTAGISLALGAASLTIALIAAAPPPVSEVMTAAQSAVEASRARLMWLTPALTIVLGAWMLAQVVLRRPLLTPESTARRWPMAGSAFGVAAFLVGVSVLVSVRGFLLSIEAIRAAGGSITQSGAFVGMGIGIGIAGLQFSVLSGLLLTRWWQGERAHLRVQ